MKYKYTLLIRLLLAFIIALLGYKIFFFLFSDITFYFSYLALSNYKPIVIDNNLIIGNLKLEFVAACVATSAYVLLSILILLTKDIGLQKSIKIFITGALTIFLVNIFRISILAYLLVEYGIKLFNTLHLFIWEVFATIFVFLLWLFLIKYYKVKEIPIYSDFIYLKKRLKLK